MRLEVEGVGKRYKGDTWGLRDFSLALEPGIVALLGPNGAGKSTLMRILDETHQIVFSVAHPLRRQLSAIWMAGFSVAVLFGGGIAVRLVAAGRWSPSFAWMAGAVFIPSLALALGTWSNGSRLFEITYMIWWYLGPVSRIPAWDFTGVTAEANATATPIAYLVVSVVLLGMAAIGRRRQLQV
jgi:hypothetical protein